MQIKYLENLVIIYRQLTQIWCVGEPGLAARLRAYRITEIQQQRDGLGLEVRLARSRRLIILLVI